MYIYKTRNDSYLCFIVEYLLLVERDRQRETERETER